MAKKIQQAIAGASVKVKNVMSGECQLQVAGRPIPIAPGETVDLTPYVKTATDVERIGGLKDLLQAGRVVLI